jgi:hypothetical protein
MAEQERSLACRPAGCRSQLVASSEYSSNLLAQVLKGRFQHIPAGIKNNGAASGKIAQVLANGGTHATLDAVADYRFANGPGNRKAAAGWRFRFVRAQAKSGKITATHADSGLIDLAKL